MAAHNRDQPYVESSTQQDSAAIYNNILLDTACRINEHTVGNCSVERDPSSKLLLPESICLNALSATARTMSRSSLRKKYGGSPRYAHALIEQSLAPQISQGLAASLILSAEEEISNVQDNEILPDKIRIETDILAAYLPAFRQRACKKTPDTRIMELTYQNLTAVLRDYPKKYSTLESIQKTAGICVQAEIAALLMRTNVPSYFLWPASFREEDGQPSSLNHDAYGIHGTQKIPIQIKQNGAFSRIYDSRITVIVYEALGFGSSMTIKEKYDGDTHQPTDDKWIHYDIDARWPTAFHGIRSQPQKSYPNDFSPFVPHTMTHELTAALVSEAHHGYVSVDAFQRIEAMTKYLKDVVNLSYAGPLS